MHVVHNNFKSNGEWSTVTETRKTIQHIIGSDVRQSPLIKFDVQRTNYRESLLSLKYI